MLSSFVLVLVLFLPSLSIGVQIRIQGHAPVLPVLVGRTEQGGQQLPQGPAVLGRQGQPVAVAVVDLGHRRRGGPQQLPLLIQLSQRPSSA